MTRSRVGIILKLLSLFTVVRGYNILVLVVAQYLSSAYILSTNTSVLDTFLDPVLFVIILASAMTVASGFIINSFYDAGKDFINRPISFVLEQYVNQNTKLLVYFWLNFLAVLFVASISFRAVLFFICYIFAIWLYSRSFKKIVFIGNIISPILVITPFFAILLYYKNISTVIFVNAIFLFFLIFMKNLFKDLENLKGDFVYDYKTITVIHGERVSKCVISGLIVGAIAVSVVLTNYSEVGKMRYYFYTSIPLFIGISIMLWRATNKTDYVILHYIVRTLIILGVFCIPLVRY